MHKEIEKQSLFNLTIDEDNRYNLKEMAKWARFLGIIGFVGIGLIFIAVMFLLVANVTKYSGVFEVEMIIGYLILLSLYLYPVITFYKFGRGVKSAMIHDDQPQFNAALRNLKNCFQYMGIMIIILLSIYGIFAIILLIMAASS